MRRYRGSGNQCHGCRRRSRYSVQLLANGAVQNVTRNAGIPQVTQYTYTRSGHVSVLTDALGNSTSTAYAVQRVKLVSNEIHTCTVGVGWPLQAAPIADAIVPTAVLRPCWPV